nr:tetraspanin-8-like [Labrus bergylta]
MAGIKVVKYLIFSINFLFSVAALIVFGLSVNARIHRVYYHITDDALQAVDLLIVIAVVTLIFSFLGCYGTVRESRCLLILFFVGLLIVFLMLLAVVMLGAIARRPAFHEELKNEIKQQLLPLSEQPEDIQEDLHEVERSGFCCGLVDGYLDWGEVAPDSCTCRDATRKCEVVDGREIYSTPCLSYILTMVDIVVVTLMTTGCVLGALTILEMVLSLVLICKS